MRKGILALGALLAASTASANPVEWPDLSTPPEGLSGGERDAAIIVGVENYTYLPDVPGAAQNALDWYRFLTARGVPGHKIRLLVDPIRDADGRTPTDDPQGTNDGILAAAAQASADVESGGTLWFVFIGHGAPGQGGDDGLLVGVDASGTARGIYNRSVSRQKILETLAEGQQAETVAVLDTCFSGRTPGGDALVADLQPVIPVGLSVSTAATVLTATSSNQFAGPLPMGGRPAFSYLTLGALRGWGDLDGDGSVTTTEAVTYSRNSLLSLVTDRVQEPQLEGGNAGLVLSTARESGPNIDEMRLALIGQSSTGGRTTGGTTGGTTGNPLGNFGLDVDVSRMLAEQRCERAAFDGAAAEQRDLLADAQSEDRAQIMEQWSTLSTQANDCALLDDSATRQRCHEQVSAFSDALDGREVTVPARLATVTTECGDRQTAVDEHREPSQAALEVLVQVEALLGQYDDEHRIGGRGTPVASGEGMPLGRAPVHEESLRAGFSGDPRSYPVAVGGTEDSTIRVSQLELASGCVGYVDNTQPAMRLSYRAGRSPLRIASCSATDTTLVVKGPDGWYCNDDAIGTNPEVRLDRPRTGTYEVFVGNVRPEAATSTLMLSELTSASLCDGVVNEPPPETRPTPRTGTATSLNHRGSPLYGTTRLTAGFSPDPTFVAGQAGATRDGAVQASSLGIGSSCRGVVESSKPDYVLDYTSGQYTLRTGFCSDGDTSVVMRTPSGQWLCDDDGGSGHNPLVFQERPESGQYQVWVGSIDGRAHRGNFWASERANIDPCTASSTGNTSAQSATRATAYTGGRPNYAAEPRYGQTSLRSGFSPDPQYATVRAGGSSDVRQMNLDPSCRGFIAPSQPDYRVNFEAGRYTFRIAACSDEDTTLVVSDGNGNWRCSDDAEGRNPVLLWNDAPSGAYDVWVGRYQAGEASARIVVSENSGPYCE